MSKKVPSGMAQCGNCQWVYPAAIVNMMRTNIIEFNGMPVCGICGLDISNQIHGTKREKFEGEVAEYTRQAAITWREKHPYDDPAKRKK